MNESEDDGTPRFYIHSIKQTSGISTDNLSQTSDRTDGTEQLRPVASKNNSWGIPPHQTQYPSIQPISEAKRSLFIPDPYDGDIGKDYPPNSSYEPINIIPAQLPINWVQSPVTTFNGANCSRCNKVHSGKLVVDAYHPIRRWYNIITPCYHANVIVNRVIPLVRRIVSLF